MKKMGVRIFVAIFKTNKGRTQKFRNLLTESNEEKL